MTTVVIAVPQARWHCSANLRTDCDGPLRAAPLVHPIVMTAGEGGVALQRVDRVILCERHFAEARERGVVEP